MKRLILIDSHAIIHRAYHALPPMTDSRGEPTGAVYGFTSILLRILREFKPDYIAAGFDLPGPTFRHVASERYKAQRPETPGELSSQFAKVEELLASFGIVVFKKEGYEADDIIATISEKFRKDKNLEIVIVTGDMDSLQLVRPGLKVYAMKKGITETVIYDEKEVNNKYGFGPEYVVDFKGLKGDPSDNISGVRGIGEKTAGELIKNFGSIDDIYKALKKGSAKISANVAEKLKSGEEDAKLSRELARMYTKVPLDIKMENLTWRGEDKEKIAVIFEKFGFRSLLKRLNIEASNVDITSQKTNTTKSAIKSSQSRLLGFADDSQIQPPGLKEGELSDFVLQKIEKPLTPILREMERIGILLDLDFLREYSAKLNKKIEKLVKEIYSLAGVTFNINSTRELSRILFEKLGISAAGLKTTEKSGAVSTGASELEKIRDRHPIVPKMLAYRELNKIKNTYADTLPNLVGGDGRVHTTYHQFGAATGRLSSSDPNLQNIPIMSPEGREIRKAFIADDGFELVSFDYSQIELRIAAHMADDQKMIETFRQGEDIHKKTAAAVNGVPLEQVTPDMRRAAKTLNFGVLYGMGSSAFAENTGMPRADAKKFIDNYFKNFSGLKVYMEDTKAKASKLGYVETVFGRRRHIPEINTMNWRYRREAERMAINMPIQGTAADIVKLSMVGVDGWIKKNKLSGGVRLLLQVHDELVLEIKKEIVKQVAPKIKEIMERVVQLKVPLVVEVKAGRSWGTQEIVTRDK